MKYSKRLKLKKTFVFWMISLDAIHHLVLPVRLAAFPLVWHGILKAIGGDKAVYDYAKR